MKKGGGGGEMGSSKKSILSYLVNAFVEWLLILMLLLNSMFTYFIFRFANRFRLRKPCLCCSSSAFMSRTADLLCHRHAVTLIANELMLQPILLHNCISKQNLIASSITQYARYAAAAGAAADGSSIDEKTILEGTCPDLVLTADNIKSTRLIRDLYSNENVVEFDFLEDEYHQKDIVHADDDGYRIVGADGFTWRCALSEAEPLMIDGYGLLGHDHESAAAASASAMRESMLESQEDALLMIKHKKINEDECYSIAYTAEGDLVMDLCRNLASAKSISTAYDNVDDIPQIKATAEQQADELSHQAHGEILAWRIIENAERRIELDEEGQPPEISNDILTRSCLQYRTIVHEKADQVACSVCPSSPIRTEVLVCEQVQGISVPPSVDISLVHPYERNKEDVPHALPNSPLPVNLEEISEMQEERYQEQAPATPFILSAADHLDFFQIDNQGSDLVDKSESFSVQNPLAISLGVIKNEEDKLPDTPSSLSGTHGHYSNWLLFEKRESAAEETFDGSINSDFECGEGISTVDKLKIALRVERKALHALYAELEEERNASAVAASQTMAMINRLQEEKASVQMEALQYQRMMEEQSEYDQEALQLLNELMVKREKEKQGLEKELEIYRRKVIDYETKEKLMMLNTKYESLGSGSSSVSCSNAEDSDEVSIDLKVDMKNMNECEGNEENGINGTPFNDILYESFSNFEEERLSILEQFKVLEEKIFTLGSENDGLSFNHDYSCIMNGTENGCHTDVKGNYHRERRITGQKAKMLLPLFDVTMNGNENMELSRNENGHDFTSYPHSSASIYETENIEEEIDHVYERIHSLEADNEFLRHCFSSLKRGDKGLKLLQEILQHLRNLRTFELEVRK